MPGALEGIRILDFSQMMLGPFATQMLGDMGADVIKVERPRIGEWERGLEFMGRLLDGDSAAFLAMNRNKRSVALDLKHPLARQALLDVGRVSDVVVENFRPGVMDRLGLGYPEFRAVRPDIIYASGSGWGQDTTYARQNRPGQDLLIQAMSGLAANAGSAGDPPIVAGSSVCDAMTSLTLATAICAALTARERLGVGQRVEVDLFSTTMAIQCQEVSALVNQGTPIARSRAGIAQPWLSAPFGIYRTADGWVALSIASLVDLAKLLELPALADLDAWRDRDEAKRLIEALTATQPTEHWLQVLIPAGIWSARVRSTEEAVQDLREENHPLIVHVDHPSGSGTLELLGCPITFSETPWTVRRRPPRVGEHTHEVLRELLGDAQVATLEAEGLL